MGKGYYFNEKGEVMPTNVYIVYGAPASGKTTYVKKHKTKGDLVVDLDYIKQSISLEGKTETPDNLLDTALAMRECIYEMIEKKEVDCESIWVVAGLPNKEERLRLKDRLKGTLIFIDADYDECIKRAQEDNERVDKKKAVQIIEKYFKNFEP